VKKSISFAKWRDPFIPVNQFEEYYPDTDDVDENDIADTKTLFDDDKPNMSPYKGPIFWGPMGIIPLGNHNLPGKLYNFWVGHTNFDLTKEHLKQLDKVPGIEVVRLMTRYRFWFAIGKQFTPKDVRNAILQELTAEKNISLAPINSILLLTSSAKQRWKQWAVIKSPQGRLDCIGDDEVNKVKNKLEQYEGYEVVACSWETKTSKQ